MVCNEKSPKAKDDKYKCNEKTNRWILKSGKTGLKMKPKSKSPVKPKSKSAMKNKSCLDSKVALQPHQIQFAKSFVEMCKNKKSDKHGAIAVHSLGSGKTLTAITTSQCYLKLYPNDIVIIITPASLITNFQKEMIKWGVENPEKYHFFTYDAFKNNPINCSNSLLIIDEAHNLRTEVKLSDKAKKAIGTKKMKKGKVTLPNIVEIIANDNPDEKPSIDIFLKGFSLKKQSKLNDFTNYLKVLPQFESCYSSNS
jgi:hypothetical protein